MSLVIRLKKTGRKNQQCYKIVVNEKRSKRDGKSLKEIGHFNPNRNPPVLKVNKQELEKWIKVGAKLSPGLKKIISA